jgi:hypothetical protein
MNDGLLTVITYVVLTLLWGSLVVLYLKQRSGSRKRDPLVASLLAVMALDAFKNVVESVFFGLVWGLAIVGMVIESLPRKGRRIIPMIIYLLMGWIVLMALTPAAPPLVETSSTLFCVSE